MNRLDTQLSISDFESLPLTLPSESAQATADFGRYTAVDAAPGVAFFGPLHYEPNYAYPLLVWLHGDGDDESQLRRVMPLISLRNYVGVAVRGTEQPSPNAEGFAWSQAAAHVTVAEDQILTAIGAVRRRYRVARNRVFLAGFDGGGSMAFRLAMAHPDMFAGVLSLGGAFPRERMPLARLAEARRVPVFLACGRESQHYPPDASCRDLRLFHSAGMDIVLRQYPCGQQISSTMLGDMDRWMMDCIRGQSSAPSPRGCR